MNFKIKKGTQQTTQSHFIQENILNEYLKGKNHICMYFPFKCNNMTNPGLICFAKLKAIAFMAFILFQPYLFSIEFSVKMHIQDQLCLMFMLVGWVMYLIRISFNKKHGLGICDGIKKHKTFYNFFVIPPPLPGLNGPLSGKLFFSISLTILYSREKLAKKKISVRTGHTPCPNFVILQKKCWR